MNVFEPLMIQSSPSRTALDLMPARSEPVPGSVIAIAVSSSPVANFGNQRSFCSSVADALKYGMQTSVWIVAPAHASPTPAAAVSSMRTALKRQSSTPIPPYCSGISMARKPCSAAFAKTSRGTRCASRHSS